MTEKSGFLGLGVAGGVAAGVATLAVLVGVLYSMGLLAPAEDPVAEPTEIAAPAPEPPDSVAEAPDVTDPPQEPAPVAETSDPVGDAPAAEPEPASDPDRATAEAAGEDPGEPSAAEQAQSTTEVPAEPQAEDPLTAPSFDVVRAAPDGTTVIAGQAAPGTTVQILVDGEVTDTQTVDSQGAFASLLLLPPSTQARVLTLLSTDGAREAQSAEEIILAPAPAPQVAEAQADEAPEPDQEVAAVAQDTEADPEPSPQTTTEADTDSSAATAGTDVTAAQSAASEPGQEPTTETTAQTDPTPEPAAVAVLRADEDGVELVQPAIPAPDIAPAQVTLDTIGYSPEGDVLLSGRAQAETLIRIYLDNAAVADVISQPDGRWRVRLEGIDPGVYTLRLDALAPDGSVLSRLETPFKRESPDALADAQPNVEPPTEPASISQITVQAGDTLWAISRNRYGDGLLYVRVFEANRDAIRDPDLIYPGQIFTIPE